MSFVAVRNAEPTWRELKERRSVRDPVDLLNIFGIFEPPVPIEAVCKALDVTLLSVRGVTWSGMIESADDPPYARISFNASTSPARRRFTIAHELGHLFLEKTGIMFRDSDGPPYNDSERAANKFAAELLMPQHMVLVRASYLGRSAATLADAFGVSVPAMEWRLKNLGLSS